MPPKIKGKKGVRWQKPGDSVNRGKDVRFFTVLSTKLIEPYFKYQINLNR